MTFERRPDLLSVADRVRAAVVFDLGLLGTLQGLITSDDLVLVVGSLLVAAGCLRLLGWSRA